jgi:hypothetical protein
MARLNVPSYQSPRDAEEKHEYMPKPVFKLGIFQKQRRTTNCSTATVCALTWYIICDFVKQSKDIPQMC